MPHNILENLQLIENTGLFCHEKTLFFGSGIPVFHHSNCDLPARALQWQAGQSELT